jgi:predicted nuclease of predicted toxin-antitoxin system
MTRSSLLDQIPAGAEDAAVAQLVQREGRILVTLDLDFADIRTYEPGQYRGIVVLRPRRASADEVVELLTRLTKAFARESPEGRLWIVDEHRIRIRGESSS